MPENKLLGYIPTATVYLPCLYPMKCSLSHSHYTLLTNEAVCVQHKQLSLELVLLCLVVLTYVEAKLVLISQLQHLFDITP